MMATFLLIRIRNKVHTLNPYVTLNNKYKGSGCVAQLVERSLLIPEVRGSNPVFGKKLFLLNICLLSTVY